MELAVFEPHVAFGTRFSLAAVFSCTLRIISRKGKRVLSLIIVYMES